jgi:hypothetical protein
MRLLLLLAACGSLGEPAFEETRLPDVAPWQDIGPLTICDGNVRLGAAAAGFCDAVPTKTCDGDGQCRSREKCLCGACRPQYCDSPADCGNGFACNNNRCEKSCASDGDCAAGESCVEGRQVCRGTCAGDGDCQTGERCTAGRCAASPCVDQSGCSCALQREPAALAHPAPLAEKGGVTLWLERDGAIVRGTSANGLEFHLAGPSLAGSAPSVVKSDSGYLMMFAANGNLFRATSSDGMTFMADASPALMNAGEPSLISLEQGFAVYFTGSNDVWRSLSSDGVSFAAPELVLTPDAVADPTLWRNVDRLASPFAQSLVDIGARRFVRLWFAARGQESGPAFNFDHFEDVPANFSIGEAASADGLTFVPYPYNPVFDRVQNFLEHTSELDPALVTLGDTQLLYYRAASGLGAARSPTLPR